jgi:hypothetical protein
MGYEFICGIPMAVGATLAMVLGLFITLERLRDWTAKQIEKNSPVQFIVYRDAKRRETQPPEQ